jgi:hypothetical protein
MLRSSGQSAMFCFKEIFYSMFVYSAYVLSKLFILFLSIFLCLFFDFIVMYME